MSAILSNVDGIRLKSVVTRRKLIGRRPQKTDVDGIHWVVWNQCSLLQTTLFLGKKRSEAILFSCKYIGFLDSEKGRVGKIDPREPEFYHLRH